MERKTGRRAISQAGRETGRETDMKPYGDKTDKIIDKATTDLVMWSRRHGYDPHSEGLEFLDTVIDYVADSMYEPEDYDFDELLQKAKDDGVFEKLHIRSFDEEFPPDEQNYTIAMSGDGRIGIFFDDSYQYYEDKWRKIDRDEVPLGWFTDYVAFTDWDI